MASNETATAEGQPTFGEWIARERATRKMSLNAFGALIGVAGSTVYRWENGQRGEEPKPRTLRKIAQALNTSEEWVLSLVDITAGRDMLGPAQRFTLSSFEGHSVERIEAALRVVSDEPPDVIRKWAEALAKEQRHVPPSV